MEEVTGHFSLFRIHCKKPVAPATGFLLCIVHDPIQGVIKSGIRHLIDFWRVYCRADSCFLNLPSCTM